MQKGENGHKGVEYGVTDLKDGKWSWDFYPKKDDGAAQSGETRGTREQAEIACKSAIDAWLRRNSD
ncbi:MAG TPA: hypothetical protein VK641_16415 [Terriglobales bacterium]|nr:hypothetical protein [Terriglobales bacterium]